jgi:hypothetical protein
MPITPSFGDRHKDGIEAFEAEPVFFFPGISGVRRVVQ